MQQGYRPELDFSPLLYEDQANYYASLIGVLRWTVEFAYLRCHEQSTLVFDHNPVDWDETQFHKYDWTDFYGTVKESLPPNTPIPRGNPIQMNVIVDADHAANKITRRSQTGILIYINRAPITWFYKAQNTVESSKFGLEFVALRIAVEMVEALRYKLWMFGIPIEGPTNVSCDNRTVRDFYY